MNSLIRRIEAYGIPEWWVRQVLPDWWDDEIADTGSGLTELRIRLARGLRLDIESLMDETAPIRPWP